MYKAKKRTGLLSIRGLCVHGVSWGEWCSPGRSTRTRVKQPLDCQPVTCSTCPFYSGGYDSAWIKTSDNTQPACSLTLGQLTTSYGFMSHFHLKLHPPGRRSDPRSHGGRMWEHENQSEMCALGETQRWQPQLVYGSLGSYRTNAFLQVHLKVGKEAIKKEISKVLLW